MIEKGVRNGNFSAIKKLVIHFPEMIFDLLEQDILDNFQDRMPLDIIEIFLNNTECRKKIAPNLELDKFITKAAECLSVDTPLYEFLSYVNDTIETHT